MRRIGALYALVAGIACCGGPYPSKMEPRQPAPELIGRWYAVRPGDTVAKISTRFGVHSDDIIELNGLVQPDRLAVGQDLYLYGVGEIVRRAERKNPSSPPRSGRAPPRFAWPTQKGIITSGFGPRGQRLHKGVDIAAASGTRVGAAADGRVIYSDNKQRGYGNLVIVRHKTGYVTVYAHNRRNLVDEGDLVRQGAHIAEVGQTGRSTGPHLHFEIRVDGKAVDPLVYLPAR